MKSPMWKTQNDLPERVRVEAVHLQEPPEHLAHRSEASLARLIGSASAA